MRSKGARREVDGPALYYRFSAPVFLALLSACAFPAGEKAAQLPDSQAERAENCALAKQRQNQSAIDPWCQEQAQGE
ncbi:hypothetical protein [Lysobacter sp. CA196]|uniref:hypothetical protein n=1 Tax=Lysobacter sp. CA196 TaxID=3455606 RepID=UPI003F8D4877